jgi:4-carboxymuconolactone decarboxylase
MDERERHAAGMAMRRRVLGDAHVDRTIARTNDVTADFQNLLTRLAWGEIWTRPGLDVRTRRILTIGTLVAIGRLEELRMHMGAALRESDGRLTPDDIKEIILQQAVYCGVPAANTAFDILRSVLDDSKE